MGCAISWNGGPVDPRFASVANAEFNIYGTDGHFFCIYPVSKSLHVKCQMLHFMHAQHDARLKYDITSNSIPQTAYL